MVANKGITIVKNSTTLQCNSAILYTLIVDSNDNYELKICLEAGGLYYWHAIY